jgi:hypothetical protein
VAVALSGVAPAQIIRVSRWARSHGASAAASPRATNLAAHFEDCHDDLCNTVRMYFPVSSAGSRRVQCRPCPVSQRLGQSTPAYFRILLDWARAPLSVRIVPIMRPEEDQNGMPWVWARRHDNRLRKGHCTDSLRDNRSRRYYKGPIARSRSRPRVNQEACSGPRPSAWSLKQKGRETRIRTGRFGRSS